MGILDDAVTSINGDNFMQICKQLWNGGVWPGGSSIIFLCLSFSTISTAIETAFLVAYFLSASTQTALCFVRSNVFLSRSFPWLRPSHDLLNLSRKGRFDFHSSLSTIQRSQSPCLMYTSLSVWYAQFTLMFNAHWNRFKHIKYE